MKTKLFPLLLESFARSLDATKLATWLRCARPRDRRRRRRRMWPPQRLPGHQRVLRGLRVRTRYLRSVFCGSVVPTFPGAVPGLRVREWHGIERRQRRVAECYMRGLPRRNVLPRRCCALCRLPQGHVRGDQGPRPVHKVRGGQTRPLQRRDRVRSLPCGAVRRCDRAGYLPAVPSGKVLPGARRALCQLRVHGVQARAVRQEERPGELRRLQVPRRRSLLDRRLRGREAKLRGVPIRAVLHGRG